MESVIVQFREQPEFTCIWRATLNPDTSPYVPWYLGITKIPVGYNWITPTVGMATHFNVPVNDLVYNPSRAWWAFQSVQDLSDADYADVIPEITYYRDTLERQWANNQTAFEATAYAAFKEDPAKGRQMLTDYTNKQAGLAWLTWRKLFDSLLEKMFGDSSINFSVLNP
jgi:dipeptidase